MNVPTSGAFVRQQIDERSEDERAVRRVVLVELLASEHAALVQELVRSKDEWRRRALVAEGKLAQLAKAPIGGESDRSDSP